MLNTAMTTSSPPKKPTPIFSPKIGVYRSRFRALKSSTAVSSATRLSVPPSGKAKDP
jgi:hypothetical protein